MADYNCVLVRHLEGPQRALTRSVTMHLTTTILQNPLPTPKSVIADRSPILGDTNLDSVYNLSQLLAKASTSTGGLTFYEPANEGLDASKCSYSDLLADAKHKAGLLGSIDRLSSSSIMLLHFDSQRETIQWLWAVTLAGFLPAIATPLVNDTAQRKKHLYHLHSLLQQPVVLTTQHLVPEFVDVDALRLYEVETLRYTPGLDDPGSAIPMTGGEKKRKDTAVLMLTSGSTGSAKAVPLSHGQILQAVQGKSAHHGIEPGDAFFNWVGLDHVASLAEVHLHASTFESPACVSSTNAHICSKPG